MRASGRERFDQRPFNTVEEMDRVMMENWKKRVGEEDEVYILGDFCYRSEKKSCLVFKTASGQEVPAHRQS